MPLNLEGSEKKSTSYSFHDCVEEPLVLVFLSVPVHTDASTQYWIHFRLKRRISPLPLPRYHNALGVWRQAASRVEVGVGLPMGLVWSGDVRELAWDAHDPFPVFV